MKARFLALAALVLGLASCQTEPEGLDVNVGGEVDTVVTVSLPETTRANSAEGAFKNVDLTGDATIRYILKIYQKVGDEYKASTDRQVEYSDGKSVVFPVRLVPNRDYRFVVWADYVTGEADVDYHYNTTDLANITLNGEWKPMDETRDAFTGYFDTEVEGKQYTGTSSINLTLKRPFAKLRVITTDMVELGHLDINPAYATVEYNTPYRAGFNAFESVAVAANVNDVKSHAVFEIAAYDDNTTANKVLFTDYLFAEQDVVKFTLSVYEDEAKNKPIKSNFFNTDIAVNRNYLTTIKGNVLTDGNNIKVDIEDAFEGNENWPDENEITEQLAYAAMFGGEVSLTADVALTEPLTIVEGANVVLNLGDYTISGPGKDAAGKVHSIVNNGKLTINGGTVKSLAENGGSAIYNYGTLELNGTTINGAPTDTANGTASYALNTAGVGSKLVVNNTTINGRGAIGATNGTKVEINGGTYHTPAVAWGHAIYANGEGTEVVVNGGTFTEGYAYNANNYGMYQIYSGDKAKVIVKGGDFSQPWDCANGYDLCTASEGIIEIYGGTFAEDPSKQNGKNYLAPGHYALQYETGKYTVKAIDAAARTFTINSKEEFLMLSTLDTKWNEFFSNGQGTDITDFWTQNGGKGADFYYKWEWTIKLNVDIDFEDATLNAPISVTKFGCFDGQNHTIKNVKIQNNTDAGLFVASSTKLQNIKLDNVHAIGDYSGNSNAGILASDCSAGIDNITITNSSVVGGKYTGGIVGYGYTYVTNCTLTNCVVKGGYKCGGVIGYICASNATGHDVTGNTLTNCTVAEAPQHADGKSEYVLGKVVGNYNCNGTCAENVVYDMTTTATNIIGKIEGGMVVNESNNDVTYVAENLEALKGAVKEENATVNVAADDYTFPSSVAAGVTIKCEEGTVFTGTSGLNINGATVIGAEFKNENGTAVSGTINGTFKDCTFKGSETLRWCYSEAGNTTVFENCVINTDFRGFHYDDMKGNVIFRNCEINGFNAYGGDGTATFEGCTFGCDESSYNGLNIYSNTNLINCTFNFVSGKINFIDMEGTGKTLKITNCKATLDGVDANIVDYVGGSKLTQNTVIYE